MKDQNWEDRYWGLSTQLRIDDDIDEELIEFIKIERHKAVEEGIKKERDRILNALEFSRPLRDGFDSVETNKGYNMALRLLNNIVYKNQDFDEKYALKVQQIRKWWDEGKLYILPDFADANAVNFVHSLLSKQIK